MTKPDSATGFRGILREAANFRALARSPYGMMPLTIIVLIQFFQIFDTMAFTLTQPAIAREIKGLDIPKLVQITALVGSIGVLASIAVGYYGDRHKRAPIVGVGTLLSGVSSVLASRANSFTTLAAPRVADDVSHHASSVPTLSLLGDYYPPESRGKAFALLGVMGNLGVLLAPIAAGAVIVWVGWRSTLVIFGVPLIVLGLLSLVLLREPVRGYFERKAMGADEEVASREDEAPSFGESWRTIWAVRTLRRMFMAQMLTSTGSTIFTSYYVFFLSEQYGLNAAETGLAFLPAALAGLAGGFLGGGLVDYFSRQNPSRVLVVFGCFMAITAVPYAVYAFRPPLAVLLVIVVIEGFAGSMIGPAVGVIYIQVVPPSVRTLGSQIGGLTRLPSMTIGVPVSAAIFAAHSYQGVFLFPIPLVIVGGLLAASAGTWFEFDRRNAMTAAMAAEEIRQAAASGNAKLLTCRDLEVGYDGVQVLFGVDLEVGEGEILALLGTNGAGKSTVLRAISGTTQASAGAIFYDGRDITHMPPHEIAGRGAILMPGGRGVFPGLSVQENLSMATWLGGDDLDKSAAIREAYDLFPVLARRKNEPAAALSGGEQQMLSLAQVFVGKPKLLMIDELSLGLSPAVVGELLETIREINRRGTAIILVEQSVNVALTVAHRAVFMEKGEVKFDGPTEELLRRPDILRAVYVRGTGGATATPRQREVIRDDAQPALEVQGIRKSYGGVVALDGSNFALREGEILGIIGPNGAGKTTLYDVISGFQAPDAGRVLYRGVDITGLSAEARARQGLVRRFQDARLFPSLTVTEMLLCALDRRLEVRSIGLSAVMARPARNAERRLRARADHLIDLLGLGAYRDKFVKELSTGLRRIVDIACVIAADPQVLLLDEPSSGIAQAEAEMLGPMLRRVRHETGCSMLIIEHDMPLITAVSDELIALEQGRVIARGTPEQVLSDERVVQAYLGDTEATILRSGSVMP